MKSKPPFVLIFTDLDGSLLDHYTYSYAPALPLLKKLAWLEIPVIPVTSKTRAEVIQLRHQLNNPHPFIVENGAAVFIPEGYFLRQPEGTTQVDNYWVKPFVPARKQWIELILNHWGQFGGQFVTFAESDIETIISMTGLKHEDAVRASLREYSEPIRWTGEDDQLQLFINALEKDGATILEGARFIHVSGNSDKGIAMQWLAHEYLHQSGNEAAFTIAAGDGKNDSAMLEVADHALIIRSPTHSPPPLTRQDSLTLSQRTGPEGWIEGIEQILGALPFTPNNKANYHG